MSLNLIGTEIPLSNIIGSAPLVLLGADKLYEYKDGVKTDHQLGMKYTVGEVLSFQKFTVKVLGQMDSAFPMERIQDRTKPIHVAFKDATGKIYRTNDNGMDVSVSASAITEVKGDPKA